MALTLASKKVVYFPTVESQHRYYFDMYSCIYLQIQTTSTDFINRQQNLMIMHFHNLILMRNCIKN